MRTLPKGPERLHILRDRHAGILGPQIWEHSEKIPAKIQKSIDKLSEIVQNPRKWVENLWRRSKIWLRIFSKGSRMSCSFGPILHSQKKKMNPCLCPFPKIFLNLGTRHSKMPISQNSLWGAFGSVRICSAAPN